MGDRVKLLRGDWREALREFKSCDVLCTDPPYSARNQKGQRTGSSTKKSTINYDALTEYGANEIAEFFAPKVRHWALIFCDHTAFRWHEAAWQNQDWYTFAPIPWVKTNAPPRMQGDGPQTSAEYVVIARPKKKLEKVRGGSRRGFYLAKSKDQSQPERIPGMKYLPSVVDLIEDYTVQGDLVVDPFTGAATIPVAAAIVGCYGLGCEVDPDTFALAERRVARGYTPKLLTPRRREKYLGKQFAWV